MLLTGFESYGGRSVNPAEQIVGALDGRSIGGVKVIGRTLPVVYGELRSRIDSLIAETDPDAVICLGLWPGEPAIRLERIAANIADFEIPDNAGAMVHGAVVEDGPAALQSTLPLEAIQERLLAAGIPAKLSGSAGQFLCNALMYHALTVSNRRRKPPPCGFIHVPYLPEQVAGMIAEQRDRASLELHQRSDLASMSLETMVAAISLAIEATLETVAR